MKGDVKWFSSERGYGFIAAQDGQDYYFAVRDVIGKDLPAGGEAVEFAPANSAKGLRAHRVRLPSVAKPAKSSSRDDRVQCAQCARRMVPRLITYYGTPTHSVCPFCGATFQEFPSPPSVLGEVIVGLLKAFALLLLVSFGVQLLL